MKYAKKRAENSSLLDALNLSLPLHTVTKKELNLELIEQTTSQSGCCVVERNNHGRRILSAAGTGKGGRGKKRTEPAFHQRG
jgi:hypothetical protein